MTVDSTAKLRLFISYSHEDEKMKNDLDKHLVMLKRSGKIEVWNDRKLVAGEEWDSGIKKEMQSADIILLLISADFNNSEYIWKEELAHAMQRHEQGTARVVPVILRKCEWKDMPYAKLQALPRGARPVTDFIDKDDAFTDIASGIRVLIDSLLLKK